VAVARIPCALLAIERVAFAERTRGARPSRYAALNAIAGRSGTGTRDSRRRHANTTAHQSARLKSRPTVATVTITGRPATRPAT